MVIWISYPLVGLTIKSLGTKMMDLLTQVLPLELYLLVPMAPDQSMLRTLIAMGIKM